MHIVYLMELLRTELPKFYMGSKSNCTIKKGKIFDSRNKEYLGSAKDKSLKNLIKTGVEYKIHIIGTFNSYQDALNTEKQAQIANDVVASPAFFNRGIATINNFTDPNYTTFKNITTKKIARLPLDHPEVINGNWVGVSKGTSLSDDEKKKRSRPGKLNGFFGRKHKRESKDIISNKAVKRWENTSTEKKEAHAERAALRFKGIPKPESQKLKIGRKNMIQLKNIDTRESIRIKKEDKHLYPSDVWLNPNTIKKLENTTLKINCVHCGVLTTVVNNKRWHGDKCKFQATGVYIDSSKIRKTEKRLTSCTINGITYKSMREAEKHTGIPRIKIKKMMKNGET